MIWAILNYHMASVSSTKRHDGEVLETFGNSLPSPLIPLKEEN